VPKKEEMAKKERAKKFKSITIWFALLLVLLFVMHFITSRRDRGVELPYSNFSAELQKRNVKSVVMVEKEIRGTLREQSQFYPPGKDTPVDFTNFRTYIPFEDPELVARLLEHGVELKAKPAFSWWASIAPYLPFVLIFALWFFFMARLQAGPSRAFTFGKSRAKILAGDRPKTTFNDVAGVDEAKQELTEIIEFLRDPRRFVRLGGRIPKGVLLLGAPGTGKTLLARAVAGEAGVPFFSISGSDFVEMFVGVGASRVRDLFEQGKKNTPCIIFIDEMDAVGRLRGAGLGGGHDEREQTLNQLLVEMDGFESNEGLIVLAATNRPDVLDPALLRPGRFDRHVIIDRPDIIGREGILKVHTRKIPLADDVSLEVLARGSPGFSGADIANLVNEAALLAARYSRSKVSMKDFEEAKDKILMGMERRSLLISPEEKRNAAYHESGHALVSKMIEGMDPIHKVTIIPRGRALGVTQQLPLDEKHNFSRTYWMNQLAFILGGRAAEKIVLNELTTGAADDIDKATQVARKMVCEWGMSENLGPLTFGKMDEEVFLGREIARHKDYSESTAKLIDNEIRRIVEEAHTKAEDIISTHLDKLHKIADALLEKEILDGSEIQEIIGKTSSPRGERKNSKSSS
jgi:cell division protease FtsH